MTPGARVQAAIEVLDRVLRGASAERELTSWGRRARYAGSGDRAAVRDHVFDALRRLRSAAWAGGQGDRPLSDLDARAVVAGLLAGQGADPAMLFTGEGHAPSPFARPPAPGPMPDAIALDMPDWLLVRLRADHGLAADPIARALRHRAPVVLRTNLARTDRADLIAILAEAGHPATPHPLSPSAIRIDGPARGLTSLPAFREGLFEMQDAGSQSLVDRLPDEGERILDLCAGGGGKALALAARTEARIFAHDADPARMRDLPARSQRAGANLAILDRPEAKAPFDGVIADVPCSGSGAWRRAPEAKWRLDPSRLYALTALQDEILDRALGLVRPGGWVAYMTCSLFAAENADRADGAARRHGLRTEAEWSCTPLDDADGFYLRILRRPPALPIGNG
jgi:16S rRNA (cytosine967-C5)-methyltransferase